MSQFIALDKSVSFALRIVKLYKFLRNRHSEQVMSRQILRSGTSIGANLAEAKYGASKKDFLNKCRISLKEAGETNYWLFLLWQSGYIDDEQYTSIQNDCEELIKILHSICNSTIVKDDIPEETEFDFYS